jgi:hypothetical protein
MIQSHLTAHQNRLGWQCLTLDIYHPRWQCRAGLDTFVVVSPDGTVHNTNTLPWMFYGNKWNKSGGGRLSQALTAGGRKITRCRAGAGEVTKDDLL